MATITINDSTKNATITTSLPALSASDADIILLMGLANTLYQQVALQFIKLDPIVGFPGEYEYKLKTIDNRLWKQKIKPNTAPSVDYESTFTVVDYWQLHEFSAQRALRDHIVRLIQAKGVTDINIVWS